MKIAVVGDTPYKSEDWKILKQKFSSLNEANYDLLIHVGDIKRGVLPCFAMRYKRIRKLLDRAEIPTLIIPGDNEFNDCYVRGPKRAIKLWRKHTLIDTYDDKFNISRQENYPENFSFVSSSVLFIGINNVGGRVHDSTEWKTRTEANIEWIKSSLKQNDWSKIVIFGHASPKKAFDLFDFLKAIAEQYEIWFIQGDIHSFSYIENWKYTNIKRVVVDNGNELKWFRTLIINSGNAHIDSE